MDSAFDKATLPPAGLQRSITVDSGEEALRSGYEIFWMLRATMSRLGRPLRDCEAVLDFGCGWGRVIRYFDRVPSLWGVDVAEEAVQACRDTIPFARFAQVDPLGPAPFDDDAFDVVYAYSVFTHLSEEAHRVWLSELKRVLRPGGLFIATTLLGRNGYEFEPTGSDHFGMTHIEESYIRERWPFDVLDYFLACKQMFVACSY